MTENNTVADENLWAYADGQLSAVEKEQLEAILAQDPKLTERLDKIILQNEALKLLGTDVLQEPIPDRLLDIISELKDKTENKDSFIYIVTRWARPTSLLAGVMLGWLAYGAMSYQQVAVESMDRYLIEASAAHQIFSAQKSYHYIQENDERTAGFQSWIQRVFEQDMRAPSLRHVGFNQLDVRILPGPDQNMGYFLYEDPSGERMSLLFWPDSDASQVASGEIVESEFIRYWRTKNFAFAVIYTGDKDNLDEVAQAVFDFYQSGTEEEISL